MADQSAAPLPLRVEWTITLDPPVKSSGLECRELKLRPPTQGEMIKALQEFGDAPTVTSRANMQTVLVSLVSGVPRQAVEFIPSYIVVGAAKWLEDFSPISPPITPS